ncbi:HEPN domain-containing protein [Stenotrophomonas acidaminiphila]|jgi:hypothetical protein|uniref:HEPN domain-containing protein n=1 Tax=Stenotrophomonas acidaminiphila TaxID=128780 RepID=UPI0020C658DF|nr:HEPN domain-containing protein [Stenotrophomonas acidaminiphila]
MDPSSESIYAGIAYFPELLEPIDLGAGLSIRPTYAHLMAPFLMAFSPAPANSPHPAPWAAVKGGLNLDINAELYVPENFSPADFFDRLNTVWWITSLLRLALSPRIHVPVISGCPFKEVPNDWKAADLLPIEAFTHRYHGSLYEPANTQESIAWVVRIWQPAQTLMRNTRFNDTYQALDTIWSTPSPSLALLTLWGALENLFSPAKQELRFRVSTNIACYLEPPGSARLELQRKLLKLYDARSSAAHGVSKALEGALKETQEVSRRVIYKMIESKHVPTKDELDAVLFGA